MSSEEDLAYLAGIIDGEGAISILATTKDKRHWGLFVRVTSCSKGLLEECKRRADGIGSIFKRHSTTSTGRPIYVWALSLRQSEHLLGLLVPFLVLKKKQAELGVSFAQRFARRGESRAHSLSTDELAIRQDYRERMRQLNEEQYDL